MCVIHTNPQKFLSVVRVCVIHPNPQKHEKRHENNLHAQVRRIARTARRLPAPQVRAELAQVPAVQAPQAQKQGRRLLEQRARRDPHFLAPGNLHLQHLGGALVHAHRIRVYPQGRHGLFRHATAQAQLFKQTKVAGVRHQVQRVRCKRLRSDTLLVLVAGAACREAGRRGTPGGMGHLEGSHDALVQCPAHGVHLEQQRKHLVRGQRLAVDALLFEERAVALVELDADLLAHVAGTRAQHVFEFGCQRLEPWQRCDVLREEEYILDEAGTEEGVELLEHHAASRVLAEEELAEEGEDTDSQPEADVLGALLWCFRQCQTRQFQS